MAKGHTVDGPLSKYLAADLAEGVLVKPSGSTVDTVAACSAGDDPIGVLEDGGLTGQKKKVQLLTKDGTLRVISAGVISANDPLYTANGGKVSATPNGRIIGYAEEAAAGADEFISMIPVVRANGGSVEFDEVEIDDDFRSFDLDESGSEGFWMMDDNGDQGAIAMTDAHGGVISILAADATPAANFEAYLLSVNEIYKPAAGSYNGQQVGKLKWRVSLTEANTNDAAILLGLLGGDTTDVDDTIADGGVEIANANQFIGVLKNKDTLQWAGKLRDSAIDTDTNVGTFTSAAWETIDIVITDLDITDAELEIDFYRNGTHGGQMVYALASATEMRLIAGVKTGGANNETLLVDRVNFKFVR